MGAIFPAGLEEEGRQEGTNKEEDEVCCSSTYM